MFFSVDAASCEGGDMAAALRYPFTNAQLKELERQAMIYKYIVASVPVPPQLVPFTYSDPSLFKSPYAGGGLNLEPGRCRRTDGKKWRCSRNVAPDHKYCERHMHRGRPRSRKHVELQQPSKKTCYTSNSSVNTNTVSTSQFVPAASESFLQPPLLREKTCVKSPNFNHSRSFDWMVMKDSTSGQEWLQTNTRKTSNVSLINPVPLNLNVYADLGVTEDHHQQSMGISLEKGFTESPIDFIDAWSEESSKKKSNSLNRNHSLSSSPTLSMAASNSIEDEMGQISMRLGLVDSDRNQSDSWVASTLGGPLAEALRHSMID